MLDLQCNSLGPRTPEQLTRWRLARGEAAEQSWLTRRWKVAAAFEGVLLALVLLLGLTGYPRTRIGALSAMCVALVALSTWDGRSARGGHGHHRGRGVRGLLMTVLMLAACAVSGGIHSPLLVLPMALYAMNASGSRWTSGGLDQLGLHVTGVLALILLPARWVGPAVPEPWFTALALFSFLVGFGFLADLMKAHAASLDRSLSELYRAWDEVASQALARARELEQVSAQLSHELKNPLAAAKALVQLAGRRTSEPGALQQLKVVESEVERMQAILHEHLTFARPIGALTLEPTRLGDLVEGVIAALGARAATASVALTHTGQAEAAVDRQRLKAALINLVANAVEASPRGSAVVITVEGEGEAVRIAVRDCGAGMNREVLQQVGTPFFTTRAQGTGLGVWLARATLEQHGGRLTYRSAPGEGTVALCTLPRVPGGGKTSPVTPE